MLSPIERMNWVKAGGPPVFWRIRFAAVLSLSEVEAAQSSNRVMPFPPTRRWVMGE